MVREIGNNSHGFSNEVALVLALNEKKVGELNSNLKQFIMEIARDKKITVAMDTIIESELVTSNKLKQDVIIQINKEKIYVSIKMGRGNSVHQEKIEEFITYLNENFEDVTEEIANAFRLFIWADGTLNGKADIKFDSTSGKVIGRFGGPDFKKLYPKERKLIQDFVDKHQEDLMNRFLFVGKNNSKVDYIYYGTPINGSWISSTKLIDYNLKEKEHNKTINLGKMGIQSWNANLKGTEASEKKRGQIQVKYGSLQKDLHDLLLMNSVNKGTLVGDKYEFDISSSLNRNKNSKFWDVILAECKIEDLKNTYVVKVTKKVKSKVSDQKVLAKSDAYLVQAEISQSDMLKYNYELTEDLLIEEKINYMFIPNTGISVKRTDSKSFTIVKMTNATFNKYFHGAFKEPNVLFTGAILYVTKHEIYKNKQILSRLNVSEKELLNLVNEIDFKEIPTLQKIKKYCLEEIKKSIDANSDLKKALFTGEGVYEAPYYINFITRDGTLSTNVIYDYSVTSGSGRSKGDYSLILKPKR